jgi:hypothetical protein
MSASRGNDANGGHVSGESGNCGQRRHSSSERAKLLVGLEIQALGEGNGWADLDCAAIADALNGSQP